MPEERRHLGRDGEKVEGSGETYSISRRLFPIKGSHTFAFVLFLYFFFSLSFLDFWFFFFSLVYFLVLLIVTIDRSIN